jgi:acyl-CoA thioester hydrolase
MFTHRLTVRFRDCDAMGHVNHAVYFTYMEQCRFAWWRHLGGGVGLPGARTIIVHADCDYLAPAHVHDEIEIALRLESLGRSSITLQYTLTCTSTQQTLAAGAGTHHQCHRRPRQRQVDADVAGHARPAPGPRLDRTPDPSLGYAAKTPGFDSIVK